MKRYLLVMFYSLLTVLSFWIALPYHALAITEYVVTDLGTLGGTESYATALNESGQVVGYSNNSDGIRHAFLWSNETGMQNLGTLYDGGSGANDINDLGYVVGNSGGRPFIWKPTTGMIELDEPPSGWSIGAGGPGFWDYGSADAINNAGQVVTVFLMSNIAETYIASAIWDTEANTYVVFDLGYISSLPVSREAAWDINNSGDIVGTVYDGQMWYHFPFIYDDLNGLQLIEDTQKGTAYSINNLGQVVGYIDNYNDKLEGGHAFIWDRTNGLSILNVPDDVLWPETYSINDHSQIVGEVDGSAVIWENGEMFYLNELIPVDSGWELMLAEDINNKGNIVGYGEINGEEHAFILIPISEPDEEDKDDGGTGGGGGSAGCFIVTAAYE